RRPPLVRFREQSRQLLKASPSVPQAALRCGLCPECAPPAPGAAPLGTARSRRAIVPSTPLPREGGMTVTLGRRELLAALGGAAAAWPLAARAQQGERVRRIGVLMSAVEGDQRGLESITAFAQGLAELGWTVGRNVRIEYRWGAGDLDRFRRYAAELIALSPDVVLATAGSIVGALQ